MRVFLIFLLVGVVVTGYGMQRATLKVTPEGVEVTRSFWAADGQSMGELAIDLAKARNTTPENAVDMTTARNTRVSRSTEIRRWENASYQSDFEARRRNLMRRFVEPPKPKPVIGNFPEKNK